MSLKLPKTVKVGYKTYKLRWMEEHVPGEETQAMGLTYHRSSTIYVNRSRGEPRQEQANTLVHELLHALFFTQGVKGFTQEQEEHVVNALANGLCTIIVDNPGLMKLIEDSLKAK